MRMRNTMLASTAALLASLVIASAQNTPREERGGAERGGATQQNERGSGASQQNRRGQSGAQGEPSRNQGQSGTGERREGAQNADQGRQQGRSAQERQQGRNAQQGQQGRNAQSEGRRDRRETVGQGGGDENRGSQQNRNSQQQRANQTGRSKDSNKTTGQGTRDRNNQRDQQQGQQRNDQQRNDQQQQGRQRDNQQQQGQQQGQRQNEAGGRISLSTDQQTRVREAVFSNNRNLPRADRVDFSLNVGTVVPTRVRVVEVPSVLIELHPEWRNHLYFVVDDDIVIVDSGRRVVGVVPVGSSNARVNRSGSRGSASVAIDNLGPDEIREVQMVLIREGFSVQADGRLGPRTRDALIQFQRRNGLEVTGRIDSRTITSLGVNIDTGSGGSTTGQGGQGSGRGNDQGGGINQSPGAGGNANPDNNPAPSGRNNNQSGGNPDSTTGQGGRRDNSNSNSPDGNNPRGSNPAGSNPSGSNPSGSNPRNSPAPGAGGSNREPGSGAAGGAR